MTDAPLHDGSRTWELWSYGCLLDVFATRAEAVEAAKIASTYEIRGRCVAFRWTIPRYRGEPVIAPVCSDVVIRVDHRPWRSEP